MKLSRCVIFASAILTFSALCPAVHAQTTPPATAPAPVNANGDAATMPPLDKIGTITLPNAAGRGDGLTIFEGRLYVANEQAGTLSVVDLATNTVLSTIADLPRCHGFAGVSGKDKGFVTVGGENKVAVVDLKSDTVKSKIDVGEEPDAILYDAPANSIYVSCYKGGVGTLIDPESGKVVGEIPLGGKAEMARADPTTGRIYQNLEDTNEIVAIDPKKITIVERYTLGGAKGPTGLAYDPARHRLFVAAAATKGLGITLDATDFTGRKHRAIDRGDIKILMASLAIGEDADSVEFDPGNRRVYVANGDGTIAVIEQFGSDSFKLKTPVPTTPGAHTLTIDPASGSVYSLADGMVTIYQTTYIDAVFVRPRTPGIPKSLQTTNFDASVTLQLTLNADGTLTETLTQSSGLTELDQAVLDAYRNVKFKPATDHGKPVSSSHEIKMHFTNHSA